MFHSASSLVVFAKAKKSNLEQDLGDFFTVGWYIIVLSSVSKEYVVVLIEANRWLNVYVDLNHSRGSDACLSFSIKINL